MRIELQSVTKGRGIALPSTSLSFSSGEAVRIVVETEQRPTVLGLIASGRMKPDTGRTLLDGMESRRELRRRTALIDAPSVSDPAPDVSLGGVLAEELMFAGVPGDPISVRRWADQLGVAEHLSTPIAEVPAADRVRVMCELAELRDGVEALVLVSPDRHGGDPRAWWATAQRFAERGFAVLAIVGSAADAVLAEDAVVAPLAAAGHHRAPTDLEQSSEASA